MDIMAGFKEIDSPVQMRLYTLTKHRFMFVFIAFCVVFVIALIIGCVGPTAVGQHSVTAKQLGVSQRKFKSGPFVLNSGGLSQFNEQLWLFCQFQLTGMPPRKGYSFNRKFNMNVKILASARDTSYKVINHKYHTRTRVLNCNSDSCDPLIIFHLGWLAYPSYLVNLTMSDLVLPHGIGVRNVFFTFKYYEDQFTQIQIWFRFVFLVLSFTVTCLFTHSLRKFPVRDWCIEQRWMSALLPLLLLYNNNPKKVAHGLETLRNLGPKLWNMLPEELKKNPLFPLIFLVQSWVPGLFDAIFQVSFFSSLLLFWLCAFHGIRQNERKFVSFYLSKIVLVGVMWVTGCSILAWQEVNEMMDPSYQYKIDIGHFLGLKIFFYIVAAVYVIYLLMLLYKAFKELRNMPYFDVRLKFLTILMLIVVLISLIAVFIRFRSASLAGASVMDISSSFQNSAEFLAFYSLFNLYLYTMAFMYSPSPHAIRDASMKSLPSSFSMVGESDDDVLFDRLKTDTKNPLQKVNEYRSEDERRFPQLATG